MNVLSSVIKNPMLLMDEKYSLSPDDFPERFHKIVFGAIDYLAHNGVKEINPLIIDDYLTKYPSQYKVYADNNGFDYLDKVMSFTALDNFEHYYNTLKKCSLLTRLSAQGFDISEFYNPDELHVDEQEITQEKLDTYSVEDILDKYDVQIAGLKREFITTSDIVECHISKGMRELKEELKEKPAFGLPMNSSFMTTICHGRRLKKFYLKSMVQGSGKTRLSMADACRLAIPQYYDPDTKKWIKTKCSAGVLFITTELEMNEIQTLLWAYVACVPEDHITDNKYVSDEEKRIEKAISIIEKSNFHAVYIAQFDMEDIENIIKRYKVQYGCDYVFFDYIYSSAKSFSEMSAKAKGFKLREDQALMVFSERLKSLCNKLNIHLDSSTQTNDDWKTMKNPDQGVIRGAKAIADKVDVGYVGLEPTEKDKEAIHSIMGKNGMAFCREPNLILHIFKIRRGKTNHVKVFIYFDYGTLRTTDLFVTDRDYKLLDIEKTNIEVILDDTDVTDEAANLKPKSFNDIAW